MYTQEDWTDINKMLKKRWAATAIPAALVLIAAIVVFVVGRIHRSASMWMLTSVLTILGGGTPRKDLPPASVFHDAWPQARHHRRVQVLLRGRM